MKYDVKSVKNTLFHWSLAFVLLLKALNIFYYNKRSDIFEKKKINKKNIEYSYYTMLTGIMYKLFYGYLQRCK